MAGIWKPDGLPLREEEPLPPGYLPLRPAMLGDGGTGATALELGFRETTRVLRMGGGLCAIGVGGDGYKRVSQPIKKSERSKKGRTQPWNHEGAVDLDR